MLEPGLDRHEWETEWQDLEERLADDPAEALWDADDLIARMLAARGFTAEQLEGDTMLEPETVGEFREARRITHLVDAGADVDPGDVGLAATSYRELYTLLLERGPA